MLPARDRCGQQDGPGLELFSHRFDLADFRLDRVTACVVEDEREVGLPPHHLSEFHPVEGADDLRLAADAALDEPGRFVGALLRPVALNLIVQILIQEGQDIGFNVRRCRSHANRVVPSLVTWKWAGLLGQGYTRTRLLFS